MALSERLAGKAPTSILRRTVLYVLGFGLGSLAVAGLLSLLFVSAADAVLDRGEAPALDGVAIEGGAIERKTADRGATPDSKGRASRGNEGATAKAVR